MEVAAGYALADHREAGPGADAAGGLAATGARRRGLFGRGEGIERGETGAHGRMLRKLAGALGVGVEELVGKEA